MLYYIAFVGAPAFVTGMNWLGRPLITAGIIGEMSVRHLNFTVRAILALSIGYSAFLAEIFRAGIESIDRGQTEAALAVGGLLMQTLFRNPLAGPFVLGINAGASLGVAIVVGGYAPWNQRTNAATGTVELCFLMKRLFPKS